MSRRQRYQVRGFVVLMHLLSALVATAQLLSPGELARPHRALEGDDKCVKCHSQGRRVDDKLCTDCHTDIGAQVAKKQGQHGTKFRGQSCGQCHVDHRGLDHELIRWPGGSRERFDHASTGFALKGAHATTKCADCHQKKNARGVATLLGLSSACASCHEDPHDKRFGDNCQSCHNEVDFKQVKMERFDHDKARFKLLGKHQEVKCVGCHHEPPKYRDLEFASCSNCHEDPHEGRFKAPCASCHDEQGFGHIVMKASAHPGLSLGGGHRAVRCNSCHDQDLGAPPRQGSRCVDCHRPVHEAKFGKDCRSCHKGIEWFGVTETLAREVHDKTPFALVGEHAEVACESCHDPKQPPAARYRKLRFERCLDCHQDPHRDEFTAREGGECASCHTEHGFLPTRFGLTAHATTAFPLDGGHAAVPCARCHGDVHPRLDLRVPKQACADCHENPHGDQFATEMQTGGCAHCHATSAWDRPRVDHSRWPLTGAHAAAACGRCHEASAAGRGAGEPASYRGVPRDCEGCHGDVHLGQFRLSDPVRGCDACHVTQTFDIERFDHARLADYALQGKHARIACDGCHRPTEVASGKKAVRYRLGYAKCADCHADPHAEVGR